MKLPPVIVENAIKETIQDRNHLIRALKAGDIEAAKKAFVGKNPYDLSLDSSDFREIMNSLRNGDIKKAQEIMGVGGEVQQRGPFPPEIDKSKFGVGARKGAVTIRNLKNNPLGGPRKLYKVKPPMKSTDWSTHTSKEHDYVIASQTPDETMIFGTDQNKDLDVRAEIYHTNSMSPDEAIEEYGYEVIA